ncbi:MAG: hypothetical protein WC960_06320 [Bacteroidales bacterium]
MEEFSNKRFNEELRLFFKENNLSPLERDGILLFEKYNLALYPTALLESKDEYSNEIEFIVLHQDLWFNKGKIVKNSLLARLGRGEKIGARECSIKKIGSLVAKEFFEANHLLGYARSKYHYALYYKGEVAAAASFSSSREMVRGGRRINSFEWVRYASLGSSRVVGGMGKLLSHFIREVNPCEIMSYACREWSRGDSYKKLGFRQVGITPPVEFWIEKKSLKRYPFKRALLLSRSGNPKLILESGVKSKNLGNYKFLLELYNL